MEMTFHQYTQNPMGASNSVMTNREMYRNMYIMKLDTIMVREMGKIEYHLYKNEKKNIYYAHIKVPSEVVEKFYYDVVIQFYPSKDMKPSKDLTKYNVRFYSNDPAFVFTFAHAFIKNEIFINEYADKMSKDAVKKTARQKNPMNTVGYVKSLYFAYLIMQRFGLFNKILYTDKYDEKYVKSTIMSADQKISLRMEAGQELSTKKKRAKAAEDRARRKEQELANEHQTKKSNKVNKINTTSMISKNKNSVKTTNTIKKKGNKK